MEATDKRLLKARATVAAILVSLVFLGGFATSGYHLGVDLGNGRFLIGWPAALVVAGIATATIGAIAVMFALIVGLAEWIRAGDVAARRSAGTSVYAITINQPDDISAEDIARKASRFIENRDVR